MNTHHDPIITIIRRALNAGPKTIAAVAEMLRLDAGVSDSVGTVADSINVAESCLLELGCIAVIENDAQRTALSHELRRAWDSERPAWSEIAITEIMWRSQYYIESTTQVGNVSPAR